MWHDCSFNLIKNNPAVAFIINAFAIGHFPFVIREFNLEVQQLLFEKYFIWGLETETLARTIV